MNVELTKKDIIRLVRGVEPSYGTMGLVEDMGLGGYTGGFEDRFDWNYTTSKCWDRYSEEELYELYIKLTKE